MALYPVKLPKSARELCRVVAMQRLLLKALCAEPMNAGIIDQSWLQVVWNTQDEEWVKKFCRTRKFSILEPIRAIADSLYTARQSLYTEFCRQNKAGSLFNAGGQYHNLDTLNGVTPLLADEVHRLFVRFYQFLSHETKAEWDGYEFPRGRRIKNESYKTALEESNRPILSVCPYCDGANEEPELDHYYAKETFPFLSCSPWNLVPACHLCNKLSAKGNGLALTPGVQEPTAEWLHPFFRPASDSVEIRLTGTPKNSIPQLYSPQATEQVMLNNHVTLIKTLETRWTKVASTSFDRLVRDVNNGVMDTGASIETLVRRRLRDHKQSRGRDASTLVHAAVCQAVLDQRPGYLEEFADPNAAALE